MSLFKSNNSNNIKINNLQMQLNINNKSNNTTSNLNRSANFISRKIFNKSLFDLIRKSKS